MLTPAFVYPNLLVIAIIADASLDSTGQQSANAIKATDPELRVGPGGLELPTNINAQCSTN